MNYLTNSVDCSEKAVPFVDCGCLDNDAVWSLWVVTNILEIGVDTLVTMYMAMEHNNPENQY